MQFPKLSLNGTNGHVLLRQYLDAAEGLRQATRGLNDIEIHGRDYVLLDSNAVNIAYSEHQERKRKVEAIIQELLDIATEIARQNDERRRP